MAKNLDTELKTILKTGPENEEPKWICSIAVDQSSVERNTPKEMTRNP